MREPHVRFCERHGGAILRAYSTDLDRAAALLRGPRSYAEEPLSAFRLKPARRGV